MWMTKKSFQFCFALFAIPRVPRAIKVVLNRRSLFVFLLELIEKFLPLTHFDPAV